MDVIKIKKNDTKQRLDKALKYDFNGSPVDVTGGNSLF